MSHSPGFNLVDKVILDTAMAEGGDSSIITEMKEVKDGLHPNPISQAEFDKGLSEMSRRSWELFNHGKISMDKLTDFSRRFQIASQSTGRYSGEVQAIRDEMDQAEGNMEMSVS